MLLPHPATRGRQTRLQPGKSQEVDGESINRRNHESSQTPRVKLTSDQQRQEEKAPRGRLHPRSLVISDQSLQSTKKRDQITSEGP